MITLKIQVPEARNRTAIAVLTRGTKRLAQGFAAASASAQIADAHGNPSCDPLRAWGHPPAGSYRLINHRQSHENHAGEYGMHFLLFEPQSGAGLTAQAAGRVGLLVYGGPPGQDKRMRRTQGGVRLDNDMLATLVNQLAGEDEVTLLVETLRKPAWWQFWKSMPDSPPLSTTATKKYPAPFDEMSIIQELMNGATRRARPGYAPDDRPDRDDHRRDDRSGSSSNSDSDRFQGGGGQSGGGGASGSWDSATTTARGVDGSGRIVAGAAVGVAAAIAAGAVAGAIARDGGGADAGDAGGSSTGTATGTSY